MILALWTPLHINFKILILHDAIIILFKITGFLLLGQTQSVHCIPPIIFYIQYNNALFYIYVHHSSTENYW